MHLDFAKLIAAIERNRQEELEAAQEDYEGIRLFVDSQSDALIKRLKRKEVNGVVELTEFDVFQSYLPSINRILAPCVLKAFGVKP